MTARSWIDAAFSQDDRSEEDSEDKLAVSDERGSAVKSDTDPVAEISREKTNMRKRTPYEAIRTKPGKSKIPMILAYHRGKAGDPRIKPNLR
jgi:hypothetical protein